MKLPSQELLIANILLEAKMCKFESIDYSSHWVRKNDILNIILFFKCSHQKTFQLDSLIYQDPLAGKDEIDLIYIYTYLLVFTDKILMLILF